MKRHVLFRIDPRGPVGNDHILVMNCRCIGAAQKLLQADARDNSYQRHRISFVAAYGAPTGVLQHLQAVQGYALLVDGGDPPPEPEGAERWRVTTGL